MKDPSWTYPPDATTCRYGHQFKSEADCVLPEDWDYFMCRACIQASGLTVEQVIRYAEQEAGL